ncbi:MAG: hypothetical protein AAF561_14415 [Planctomycetota bacterium]
MHEAYPAPAWQKAVEAARDDRRPRLPEPPPIRIEAVADVHLPMSAGLEVELDDFYTRLLPMVRREGEFPAYDAEDFGIVFDVVETRPDRDELRPVLLRVRGFDVFFTMLQEQQIEFQHLRGVGPGDDAVLLRDPAGNWVQVAAWREFG